ncbi:hypothetical protein ACFFX1_01425 [Dactylosporangium sucinum]|uniref:Uncharacterized protein n=1 Tax=Dactylosporangium sucinum TaxID=1424081 RepID=A0A917T4N4_9ACTN|nr:hypothetical protein [Dactylosporangium sucinum]GGM09219.1 hypothetical protein GCM10007977_007940 [Dactylosporangium sucinum]
MTSRAWPAAVLLVGLGAGAGVSRTVRDGDDLLAIDRYSVSGLSLGGLKVSGFWKLDACRDAAAWVPLGGRRLLRYGGRSCGGDVPEDPGPLLAVVELKG